MPDLSTAVIFRLSALGDIVLTTGVLDYWHTTRGLSFIYLTRPGPAAILGEHPAIKQIITLDGLELKGKAWLNRAGQLAREFKGLPLIDLHGTLRSRILSLRWKGPVHRYPKFGLKRRLFNQFGTNSIRLTLEETCVTQRYALALEDEPPVPDEVLPSIPLTAAEIGQGAVSLAATMGATMNGTANARWDKDRGGRIIALHPYATHPDKAWPRQHWLDLAALLTQAELPWVVIGRDTAPLFSNDPRDLTNRTNLRETCGLLKGADVLVTNDSGPMHLAAGVDTPVVTLFGPTAKAWGFYPQGPYDRVLEKDMGCRPCSLHGKNQCPRGKACLTSISPQETLEAVLATISGR